MRSRPRAATEAEAARLWPAVRSERIFETADEFARYRAEAPWRVRVNDRGDAALLGVWREHFDVLAIRGVWCPPLHLGAFVADARAIARDLGLAQLLSPLLALELLGPYRREGMELRERIVAIQGHSHCVLQADPPIGVTLRAGRGEDLAGLVELDAICFDEFWRYGMTELAELFRTERLVVAETVDGELIGYTLATASRGASTLGRLGVAVAARRHGLARALVTDVARWAVGAGAETLSLCTQEENAAARALYCAAGLTETRDLYGLAICRVAEEGSQ